MRNGTVRQWLLEHTPLEPSLLEGAGFAALVAERVAVVARGDESEYVATLDRSPDEVERLAADIAVPETWLLRYPNSFELLVDVLRHRASAATAVRMCSIGCATGLEPYSMAMAAIHAGLAPERVQIDAFDRNPVALAVAAAGVYGPAAIRGEIPAWAAGFLAREGGAISIDARIRGMIRFERRDVTVSGVDGPYDVVFCRNVLIYLNATARSRLVQSICGAMVPGGVLFVGHAEQFLRGEAMLRTIAAPHTFALQRVEGSVGSGEAPVAKHPTSGRLNRTTPIAIVPDHQAARARIAAAERPPARVVADPPGVDRIEEARDLADAGRMAESEALVRSIIACSGPSSAALELLGLIRIAADDAAGAKRLFEQAVYLEPDRTASLLQLAMISERAGDMQHAAMYWNRARRASSVVEKGP